MYSVLHFCDVEKKDLGNVQNHKKSIIFIHVLTKESKQVNGSIYLAHRFI